MTQRQSIINVICACLFCFGFAEVITGPQIEHVWFGLGWVFASILVVIFNNFKIKE